MSKNYLSVLKKSLLGLILAGLALSVTACGGGSKKNATPAKTDGKVVEISVGYENAKAEPAAIAVEKWKELVEKKSNGTIKLKLFPRSVVK